MNILLVIPPGRMNLARSYLRELVDIYLKHGHRVLAITATPPEDGDNSAELFSACPTIYLPTLNGPQGTELFRIGPLSSEISQTIQEFKPHIVHSFSSYLLGATAVRLATHYEIPLVYSYALWHDEYPDLPKESERLRRFHRAYAIAFCNMADLILVSESKLLHELQIHGVTTAIDLVPRGVNLNHPAQSELDKARSQLGISAEAFVIGISATALDNPRFQLYVRSLKTILKRHPHVQLLLIGVSTHCYALRSQFITPEEQKRLHTCELSPSVDWWYALAALDCVVCSESGELTTRIAMESLAKGIPLLAAEGSECGSLIREGENGFLFQRNSHRSLIEKLNQARTDIPGRREQLSKQARLSVSHLTTAAWAENTLDCYKNLSDWKATGKLQQEGEWELARKALNAEWQLWVQRVRATGAYLSDDRHPSRVPFLRHVFYVWRKLRRWFSRREWSVQLLGLPTFQQTSDEPGLILIQIDGLARSQLERALKDGRMPFLARLIKREHYAIESMYSGLPATTPAVLGELFYGVRQAVPAFGFRDHRSGQVVQMFHPAMAATIQEELSRKGAALLAGGAAYCDIYSGGAENSSFCPATTGWHVLQDVTFWRRTMLFVLNLMSLVRICALACIELVVGLFDSIRGIYRGIEIFQELIYVPRRLIVNIVLREFVAISAEIDATRGVPVIHMNLLGYDENAHRRGPSARFAHYALGGIDHVIKRIWDAANASQHRDYQVWIMADHGQQHAIPYANERQETVVEAVNRIYRSEMRQPTEEKYKYSRNEDRGIENLRAAWLRSKPRGDGKSTPPATAENATELPKTVAIGPLGYIYWPIKLEGVDRNRLAQVFVDEAAIPLVIFADGSETWAWTKQGRFSMPEEAATVLAPDHPYRKEVAGDLVSLCRHVDAGDFVILGWRNDKLPLSFVQENGAHAGPGPDETSGFIMAPADAITTPTETGVIRPLHLRQMAQRALGRRVSRGTANRTQTVEGSQLRLVTYNVHSCIGLDGRLSVSRIARVLAATQPDVIALQELDVRRRRSGFIDQAAEIAQAMAMEFHFHSNLSISGEEYGNAILSRFPLRVISTGGLPTPAHREPRGVLWVEVQMDNEVVQVMTTHLGLSTEERDSQVSALLSERWLGNEKCRTPLIVCGDFNFMPSSRPYNKLAQVMHDVQTELAGHKPRRTWFSPLPLTRIDHVFIDSRLRILRIDVPRTRLAKIASDHLPLVVDLEIVTATVQEEMKRSLSTARAEY